MGLVTVALLVLVTVGSAGRAVVIEDWTANRVSQQGIPSGWTGAGFGRRADYDFTIEQAGEARVLHLKSQNEHSTIVRDIKGKVHLKETPILKWTWKASVLPTGGDVRRKETYNMAALSGTTALVDHRLCLGCDNSGVYSREEPKDRDGDVHRAPVRTKRSG
jgi:hypothetical protein